MLFPPNEGSLAGCELLSFEPIIHGLRARGWIVDFPSQVLRRLLEYLGKHVQLCYELVKLHGDLPDQP